jgi:hypothetical protein
MCIRTKFLLVILMASPIYGIGSEDLKEFKGLSFSGVSSSIFRSKDQLSNSLYEVSSSIKGKIKAANRSFVDKLIKDPNLNKEKVAVGVIWIANGALICDLGYKLVSCFIFDRCNKSE